MLRGSQQSCGRCKEPMDFVFVSFETTDGLKITTRKGRPRKSLWDRLLGRDDRKAETHQITGMIGEGERRAYKCYKCEEITFRYTGVKR